MSKETQELKPSRNMQLVAFKEKYGGDCVCPLLYDMATIGHLTEYKKLQSRIKELEMLTGVPDTLAELGAAKKRIKELEGGLEKIVSGVLGSLTNKMRRFVKKTLKGKE